MIEQLISYILTTAKRHKAVNYAAYKRAWNINDQHNHKYFQFILDDECMLDTLVSESGILTLKLQALILGFVQRGESVLNAQETALHIALDMIAKLEVQREIPLQIRDYSVVSFSEYTDDNSAGVKLDLQLVIPSPINLCEFEDNFIDKTEEKDEEIDIDSTLPIKKDKEITLKPIRLN